MSKKDSDLYYEAVLRDDADTIAALIDKGIDLESPEHCFYPMHAAVLRSRLNVIRILAENGVDLNSKGPEGIPPVMYAVYGVNPKPEVVELLLELGADPDAKFQERQYTALFTALWRQDSLESARILIEHGADIFGPKDLNGNNAVRFAVHFECDDILELMVSVHGRRAKSAITAARRDLKLIAAARANDAKAVKQAIADGARINTIDPYGWFALFLAAEHGNTKLIDFLLRRGAKISQSDEGEKTPLMAAALGGHREAVELLLERGANLLEEVIPGERLSDGQDMDAVAFAREGPNRQLYEYLHSLRTDLRREERKLERRKLAEKLKKAQAKRKKKLAKAKKTASTKKKSKSKKASKPKAKKTTAKTRKTSSSKKKSKRR